MIYRITDSDRWQQALSLGFFASQDLAEEGFIHCSTILQIVEVANRLYRGESDLVLLEIEESKLTSPLKWEDTHNSGEVFPHVYGVINLGAIARSLELNTNGNGTFELPSHLKT